MAVKYGHLDCRSYLADLLQNVFVSPLMWVGKAFFSCSVGLDVSISIFWEWSGTSGRAVFIFAGHLFLHLRPL